MINSELLPSVSWQKEYTLPVSVSVEPLSSDSRRVVALQEMLELSVHVSLFTPVVAQIR